MHLFLKRLNPSYGYNPDGCNHRLGYGHADRPRGRSFHVHHVDPAALDCPHGFGLHRLPHPTRHPRWKRGSARLKSTIRHFGVATALLGGVLFAFPARAELLFDNSGYTTAGTAQNYLVRLDDTCGVGDDLTYDYKFTYNTSTEIEISSVYFPVMDLNATTTNVYVTLTGTSGVFVEQDTQLVYPSTTSVTFTFDNPLPVLDGSAEFQFSDAQALPDLSMNYGVYWDGVDTANLSGFTDQTYTYYGSCAGAPLYANPAVYGNVPVLLYGESGITELPDGGAIPPTSTYDGTYSELLPSFGWGSSTITGSSTLFTGHLAGMAATGTDQFPMCVVVPWFHFLDSFVGGVNAVGIQSFVIGGGMYATTTFTLSGADNVFAATGAGSLWLTLLPILEAMAWLALGGYILRNLFGAKEQDDIV